ncbi:hypothetical protein [uncultured Christiangramia sp.]|uniref:hypothetical protein n=1 Tax=Christiangramia sp. 3-2217-3z TaxID=3417564 RepID=UPI00260299FA|nr:hypothetical protein [uncultured Christiangramia sp.]
MKDIFFISALFISLHTIFAQQVKIDIVDSYPIIKDIKIAGKNSEFYSDLDYEAFLFLYPNEFDLLNKISPETTHLQKYEDYQGAIIKLPFRSKEIKSIFSSTEKLKQIIKMISPETEYKFGNIYLRTPNKVFINIYGDAWSSSYGFQLEKEKLKLKYEIKNIE